MTESCPLRTTGKPRRHHLVFDGTDKTVPQNLTDSSVVNEIEEINEGTVLMFKWLVTASRSLIHFSRA